MADSKKDKRIGNQSWRARSTHGKSPKFRTGEDLWSACIEYFDWIEDNPIGKGIVYQGELSKQSEPLMRAMTIAGLCLFLDICEKTWANYREKDDYIQVITRAEAIIYNQKFTGAAAGLLNPNIIARDLGLRDKQDIKHSGIIGMKDVSDMSDEELEAEMNRED